jgi:hypothetical protein
VLPLSYAQQRLWFIEQLEPGTGLYNIPFALRVEGELEVKGLRWSVEEIVRRHEVLRTSFPEVDGLPVQQISDEIELEVALWDVSQLGVAEREREAERLAQEESWKGFDLEKGRLLRVGIVRLGEPEHVVLFTLHHIVADGWSMGILVREFIHFYECYIQNRQHGIPQLTIQYADFSVWQRSWLEGDLLQKQLEYWRTQLAGSRRFKLAGDRIPYTKELHPGKEEIFEIDQQLTQKLKALSRHGSSTLFMTLLAAYQVALSYYSGQHDIAVGTDVANRMRLETEDLIGLFTNQLVLRTDLSGNPSFRELLQRVRRTVLGAYAHQDVPFDKIVDELQPERRLGENPLFSIKIVLQNVPQKPLSLSGLTIKEMALGNAPPKFDILLNLLETEHGLQGFNSYNGDLFQAATMRGLLDFYRAILSAVAESDEVLDIPLQSLISRVEQKIYSSMVQTALTGLPAFRSGQARRIPAVRSL